MRSISAAIIALAGAAYARSDINLGLIILMVGLAAWAWTLTKDKPPQ